MDFDEALQTVGQWGRYQKQVYAIIVFPIVFKGFHIMLVVFTTFVPNHRCAVPGLLNDTYEIVDERHRRLVMDIIPTIVKDGQRAFDACKLYADYAEILVSRSKDGNNNSDSNNSPLTTDNNQTFSNSVPGVSLKLSSSANDSFTLFTADNASSSSSSSSNSKTANLSFVKARSADFDSLSPLRKSAGFNKAVNERRIVRDLGSLRRQKVCEPSSAERGSGEKPSLMRRRSSKKRGGVMTGPSVKDDGAALDDDDKNEGSYRRRRPTVACSRWVYDQSTMTSTLVSKFDMVCERRLFHSHADMMLMAGMLLGSSLATAMCDWIGRKRFYCGCLSIMIVFSFLCAYPTSIDTLFIYRFLSGVGLMGIMISGFVLVVELIGGPMRTTMGVVWQMMWLMGPFILAGLSYCLRDWYHLQLVGSAPLFIFFSYWRLVPESPRWLVSKGRVDEAMVTLSKMASVNKKEIPPDMAQRLNDVHGHCIDDGPQTVNPLVLCTSPVLLLRSFVISFNWVAISMVYVGLSFSVANLRGTIRFNFFVSCSVELIGYLLASCLLGSLGRKTLHVMSMLVGGLACLSTVLTVMYAGNGYQWTTTALAMIGKLGVSSSFAVIYLYTAEVYPTVVRNFGVGSATFFARIGSIVAPYVTDLGFYIEGIIGAELPLIVFGSLTVAAGLLSLFLPETLHRKMPETVQDAIDLGKKSYLIVDRTVEGSSVEISVQPNVMTEQTSFQPDTKKEESSFQSDAMNGESSFQSDLKKKKISFQSDLKKGQTGFQWDVKTEKSNLHSDVKQVESSSESSVDYSEAKAGAGINAQKESHIELYLQQI